MGIRFTNKITLLTSILIFLCIFYWISRASDDTSRTFKSPTQWSTSIEHYTPKIWQGPLNEQKHEANDAYAAGGGSYHSDDEEASRKEKQVVEDKKTQAAADDTDWDSSESVATTTKSGASSLQTSSHKYPAKFPRVIWQTSSEEGRIKYKDKVESWKRLKAYEHHMLTDDDANTYVQTHFATHPSILTFWNQLTTVVLRADFLRYLIMLSSGGIYSDVDTTALTHPDTWIPISLGAQPDINAIIGVEYDDHTMKMFVRPIGLCQWTLMSKPNHPIFQRAVERVMSNLEFLARRHRTTISDLKLEKLDVLEATGPGMITDVVVSVIRDQMGVKANITWDSFHGLKEPKLFGDVLVLPINGFAGSQKHSHAGDPEYGDMFVQHHFGRTWYKGEKNQVVDGDGANSTVVGVGGVGGVNKKVGNGGMVTSSSSGAVVPTKVSGAVTTTSRRVHIDLDGSD